MNPKYKYSLECWAVQIVSHTVELSQFMYHKGTEGFTTPIPPPLPPEWDAGPSEGLPPKCVST